ncbi:MAG: TetR/AcrR family transcriptional regulator [Pseudomonadales bacterium]|nr:TetR/AcrR family transcriptional regulator [Pseudomonadales bacterium]
MKTRDRILLTSLDLFNLCGEPNVTTIDIANEMDISPGNLYYHFRNKDEIIFELFLLFEASISEVLDTPQTSDQEIVDYWMYIHIIFEKIWEYRFFYRDLVTILERNEKLQKRFNRILDKKANAFRSILASMSEAGIIEQTDLKIQEAIATNVVLTAIYWLNYQQIRNLGKELPEEDLGQGVYQVMTLIAPYLPKESMEALDAIASSYLT